MKTESLPKCLRKYADKIQDVSDERSNDNGYWVYLKEGWRDDEGETHCIHEDSPFQCAKRMSGIVLCVDPKCCRPLVKS